MVGRRRWRAGIDDALLGGTDVVFGNGGAKVGEPGLLYAVSRQSSWLLVVVVEGLELKLLLGAEVTFSNDGGGGAVGGNGRHVM